MRIKLNVDSKSYYEKPDKAQIAIIVNRMKCLAGQKDIEPQELAQIVSQGKSFTPALVNTTGKEGWRQQQLIVVDIDNDEEILDAEGNKIIDPQTHRVKKRCIENPMLPDEAMGILRQHNIKPMLLYWTFHSREDWPRYRIVILLSSVVYDVGIAMDYTKRIAGILRGTDASIATPERIILGGRNDCIIYEQYDEATALEQMDALPAAPADEPQQKQAAPAGPNRARMKLEQLGKYKSNTHKGMSMDELKQQCWDDIGSFDIASWVTDCMECQPHRVGNTTYFNPCPVCGHTDDFYTTQGGSCWFCKSDSNTTGIDKGNIINLLQAMSGCTDAEAMEHFKFHIMDYSKDEWMAAYRAQQAEETMDFDSVIENDWMPSEIPAGTTEQPTEAIEEAPDADDPEQNDAAEASTEPTESTSEKEPDRVTQFLSSVKTERYKPRKTGLAFFDDMLGGGLIAQTITLILAAPATGKTTLCQQLAEAMAVNGMPVIYLNFEQSWEQMFAKSFSRMLYEKHGVQISATEILQGYKWKESVYNKKYIEEIAEDYRANVMPHIMYNPQGVDNKLQSIDKYLHNVGEYCKKENRQAPAVFLDYLHLVTADEKIELQEVIKRAVKILKDYALAYNTIAVAVSATNRASNKGGEVTMESGRDTSGLEYGADYQLGLNYYYFDTNYMANNSKNKSILESEQKRRMILKVLKSRFSIPGADRKLWYESAYNIFYDVQKKDEHEFFTPPEKDSADDSAGNRRELPPAVRKSR